MKMKTFAQTVATIAVVVITFPAARADDNNPADNNANLPDSIRPFHVSVPDSVLVDLRHRIAETRWPDAETVPDRTQGVQLAKLQDLVNYWETNYDWRKVEARLNSYPQYLTTIDGVDINFIWVRSKESNAMPIIITHGWPGSVIEQLKVIDPLTDPVAHGGRAEDSFDVVIPSMPGYGFSSIPRNTGWDPDHIARAWAVLMKRLGYTNYVAQGGDWGSPVCNAMARQAPAGLLGIHVNLPATIPPEVGMALLSGVEPTGLSDKERAACNALEDFNKNQRAYSVMMATRPQTIGYALMDSPAGLAAFICDYHDGEPLRMLTKDDLLDDITLYWVTGTAASAARLYWENQGRSPLSAVAQKTDQIKIPVAISVFPGEIYCAPETWARRAYHNLIYFHEAGRGGHFAAWEEPELFASELRAAFAPLRPGITAQN